MTPGCGEEGRDFCRHKNVESRYSQSDVVVFTSKEEFADNQVSKNVIVGCWFCFWVRCLNDCRMTGSEQCGEILIFLVSINVLYIRCFTIFFFFLSLWGEQHNTSFDCFEALTN